MRDYIIIEMPIQPFDVEVIIQDECLSEDFHAIYITDEIKPLCCVRVGVLGKCQHNHMQAFGLVMDNNMFNKHVFIEHTRKCSYQDLKKYDGLKGIIFDLLNTSIRLYILQ